MAQNQAPRKPKNLCSDPRINHILRAFALYCNFFLSFMNCHAIQLYHLFIFVNIFLHICCFSSTGAVSQVSSDYFISLFFCVFRPITMIFSLFSDLLLTFGCFGR